MGTKCLNIRFPGSLCLNFYVRKQREVVFWKFILLWICYMHIYPVSYFNLILIAKLTFCLELCQFSIIIFINNIFFCYLAISLRPLLLNIQKKYYLTYIHTKKMSTLLKFAYNVQHSENQFWTYYMKIVI